MYANDETLSRLRPGCDSNKNESLHSTQSSIASKSVFQGRRGKYVGGMAQGVIRKAKGYTWSLDVSPKLGLHVSAKAKASVSQQEQQAAYQKEY